MCKSGKRRALLLWDRPELGDDEIKGGLKK
jgi:hypothetical protein